MPDQELMKVEAKWQCLTVTTVKLCAGPGGHLSHKLCQQSRHNAGWMDLLHTDTGDTCHVTSILGAINDAASKPALESPS